MCRLTERRNTRLGRVALLGWSLDIPGLGLLDGLVEAEALLLHNGVEHDLVLHCHPNRPARAETLLHVVCEWQGEEVGSVTKA